MPGRILEYQIPAEVLLAGIHNQTTALLICKDTPTTLPGSACSAPSWLDHVELGEPSLAPSAKLGVLRINVPLSAVLVPEDQLRAHGVDPTPPCQVVSAVATFDMFVSVVEGAADLHVRFAGLDSPGLAPQVGVPLAIMILAAFPEQIRPLDLEPLSPLLGGGPAVVDGRIILSSNGQRVAVRLVLSGGPAVPEEVLELFVVDGFMVGPSRPWSLYIGADIVESAVEGRVSAGLVEAEQTGKINVVSWPSAKLTNIAETPPLTAPSWTLPPGPQPTVIRPGVRVGLRATSKSVDHGGVVLCRCVRGGLSHAMM
jgi:hypothetical protein